MVITQILQQVATKSGLITREAAKYADYLRAGIAGTAIGIGNNPEIRQSYEYWKGKNRGMSWRDKVVRRRFKGDVYIDESSNTQQEALRTDEPVYRVPERRRGKSYLPRYRGAKYPSKSYRRRCTCKGRVRRTMVRKRKYKRRW